MYKIKKSIISMVVAPVFLAGCGDDAKDTVQNFANEPDMNGRYSSECAESDLANLSARTTYRFENDNSFSQYKDYYKNDDCSDSSPLGRLEIAGEYVVDSDGAPESEGGAIELKLQKAFIKVDDKILADALNVVNFCGASDYKNGSETEITGGTSKTLCPVEKVPSELYGVYREDDGTFFLNEGGLSEMSESSANRPTALDTEVSYTKQ